MGVDYMASVFYGYAQPVDRVNTKRKDLIHIREMIDHLWIRANNLLNEEGTDEYWDDVDEEVRIEMETTNFYDLAQEMGISFGQHGTDTSPSYYLCLSKYRFTANIGSLVRLKLSEPPIDEQIQLYEYARKIGVIFQTVPDWHLVLWQW